MQSGKFLFAFFFFSLLFWGCQRENDIKVHFDRFDSDLYQVIRSVPGDESERIFVEKYKDFLPLYIKGVLRITQVDSTRLIQTLRSFFRDSTLLAIYAHEQQTFNNMESQEAALSSAMTKYHRWFPKQPIPQFRIHLSAFAQSVITSDSLVSVAGDKFLGANYSVYKSFFYRYQLPLMQTESLVPNALKAFLQGRFPAPQTDVLLDKMIYSGVVTSAVQELMPDAEPSLLLDYSDDEFRWLADREKEIWVYMVENEQLYSTDALLLSKYMEEAPFTSIFGQESPSRIGRFIGYRIVQSYLKKNSVSVSQLLAGVDAQKILGASGYRP